MASGQIQGSAVFQLPQMPAGVDPSIAVIVQPLYTAMYSLFNTVSSGLGASIIDPTTAAPTDISLDKTLNINNFRKAYLTNSSGVDIPAGRFIGIDSSGNVQLAHPAVTLPIAIAAVSPLGFAGADIPNGSIGLCILFEGVIVTGGGLTPGSQFEIAANGLLQLYSSGTIIALALTPTILYVRIPLF